MKRVLLLRFSALAVMLIYILSSVGINVHSCLCSGTVSVSIAGSHVCEHEHNSDEEFCEVNHELHHSIDCCSDRVFKIVITGCSCSDDDTKVPVLAVIPSFICPNFGLQASPAQLPLAATGSHRLLPPEDILRDNCVLRV